MILHNLFPVPVAKLELGREFSSEEIDFVLNQNTHKNAGNTTSNDHYVLRNDTLSNLLEFIQKSLDQYLHEVHAPKNETSLRITQSWLNYTKPTEWHHKHFHPNSFVSGVLYMKAARECDKIYFYNESYRQIDIATENFNLYNSKSWWFEVNAGDLLLFPSSLAHMVQVVTGEDTRISLSFNTFPVGKIGIENELYALELRD